MEPAVRSPRTGPPIITARALNAALGFPCAQYSRVAERVTPVGTLPPGTEFLDAETEGQIRPERPPSVNGDRNTQRYRRKPPQKRPIRSRRCDLSFRKTGWGWAQ